MLIVNWLSSKAESERVHGLAVMGVGISSWWNDEWPKMASLIECEDVEQRKMDGDEAENKSDAGHKGRRETADTKREKTSWIRFSNSNKVFTYCAAQKQRRFQNHQQSKGWRTRRAMMEQRVRHHKRCYHSRHCKRGLRKTRTMKNQGTRRLFRRNT